MRIALVLVVALSSFGCHSGLSEYDPCSAEETGALACAVGCLGGGVGCDAPITIAATCEGRRWASAGDCNACQTELSGAVSCDGLPRAAPLSTCAHEAAACSLDGETVLACIEGRFVVREKCEQGTACGRRDDGLNCI